MFKQTRTVVIVLGLAIAIAYCDRRPTAPPADDQPIVNETTQSTGAPSARNAAPDHPGHIAVIDLDKITLNTGQEARIEKASQILEMNLQKSIRTIQRNVQKELVAKIKEIGPRPESKEPEPMPAEKKLIEEWVAKMENVEQARRNAVDKIRQAAEQQRQANQKKILANLDKIRDRIAPLAKKIAANRGLDVVVSTSSTVIAYSDAVDITDDVYKIVVELIKAGNFPTVEIPKSMREPRPPRTDPRPIDRK
jgi:Skp family chaperone for outer membrane proteins